MAHTSIVILCGALLTIQCHGVYGASEQTIASKTAGIAQSRSDDTTTDFADESIGTGKDTDAAISDDTSKPSVADGVTDASKTEDNTSKPSDADGATDALNTEDDTSKQSGRDGTEDDTSKPSDAGGVTGAPKTEDDTSKPSDADGVTDASKTEDDTSKPSDADGATDALNTEDETSKPSDPDGLDDDKGVTAQPGDDKNVTAQPSDDVGHSIGVKPGDDGKYDATKSGDSHEPSKAENPTGANRPRDEEKDGGEPDKITEASQRYTIKNDDISVKVDSEIKIERTDFNIEKLRESKSAEFLREKERYEKKLTKVYSKFPNVEKVTVNSFSEGSLIVRYTVVYALVSGVSKERLTGEVIKNMSQSLIDSLTTEFDNINTKHLENAQNKIRNQLVATVKNPCLVDDVCHRRTEVCSVKDEGSVTCTHKCVAQNPGCQNEGKCVIQGGKPVCRTSLNINAEHHKTSDDDSRKQDASYHNNIYDQLEEGSLNSKESPSEPQVECTGL
ncbi:nucleoporin NSP1 [Elysia marginata]|uniref:Nucleoporin NSP1 n=1 Tax=Elysia marginata TaxID=1093978 RepID=A0AAV4JV48_9GAST|nr:nucleoporin NSP1 [Elysia marginata]